LDRLKSAVLSIIMISEMFIEPDLRKSKSKSIRLILCSIISAF